MVPDEPPRAGRTRPACPPENASSSSASTLLPAAALRDPEVWNR